MNTAELLKFIEKWAARFDARLAELVGSLDVRVQGMQRELVRRIMEALAGFEFENGRLKRTPANIRAMKRLERVFDGFTGDVLLPELNLFASELLEVAGATTGYYVATNPGATEQRARKALELVREVIGIDENGVLYADGYLYRLSAAQQVRDAIRDYVVRSIVAKRTLSEFQKGFKALIQGTKGIDGAMQRYWRQYTYDTYNRVHEVANEAMAESMGLRYFIYQGSIIITTRAFCKSKAGKVFSTEEAAKWKDDPDLIDQKTKVLYMPLIDRGRYNCRHFLTYISDELAGKIRPDLKK